MSAYDLNVINEMINVAEPVMVEAGLEVKPSKCALFYGRRSGNNWYKGKRDIVPIVSVNGEIMPLFRKDEPYKYLGKCMSLKGEDTEQITEFVGKYKLLVDQIKACELPLVLKCSAFNNFALAKILHHFYNTRLSEIILHEMNNHLVGTIRELFGFYKSTSRLIIFIPRLNGGLGIINLSDLYYTTRISFLIKMLNHEVENFRYIARESLKLDMIKRGVRECNEQPNFLGFELTDDCFLKTHNNFGCQSDWPDMVRYARKLNVQVKFIENEAVVIYDGMVLPNHNLQKKLFDLCVRRDLANAESLTLQGPFFCLKNVNMKASHSIFYNWKVNDELIKFVAKARLNILPTNFTTHIWNSDNNPLCPFGCNKTESMAHLLNGCQRTFGNFYSRRHNRIVKFLGSLLESGRRRRGRVRIELNCETVFPRLRDRCCYFNIVDPILLSLMNYQNHV